MAAQANVEDCAPAIDIEIRIPASERRRRWFELCLVLLVAVGTYIATAVYLLKAGPSILPHNSSLRWTTGIVHQVTALALLAYVLSRRGLSIRDLGLRWSLRDIGTGVLLTGLYYVSYFLALRAIRTFQFAVYGSTSQARSGADFFAHPTVAAIPYFLLNPLFEEIIVRAYLMTEVRELTGSWPLAILLSVVVQSLYHLYYGWTTAIALSFGFLTFAICYARSRRALPVVVAHEIVDIRALAHIW